MPLLPEFLPADPWVSAETANVLGAYGGAAVGVLGALVGSLCGLLVPKGKGRAFVLGAMATISGLGVLLLILGLVAVFQDQPYAIYYPLLLLGFMLSLLFGLLRPVIRRRYEMVEHGRLEADALRRS